MAHKKTKTERNVTTDEGKVSGQQPQMYAKNSLDRFGDDLCQHLLSYLPLEDRFRHECLSKQWQRLIYETIDGITINRKLMKKMKTKNIFGESFIDYNILSLITRKCPNIETIDCRKVGSDASEVFAAIDEMRDNCRHLKTIHCEWEEVDDNLVPYLCQLFGPLFAHIVCFKTSLKHCLTLCHKLSHLTTRSLNSVFDETANHLLAKNLTQFEFTFDSQFTNDMFNTFMANNKSLKTLTINRIDTNIESQETVIGLMNRLSELQELRKLEIFFRCSSQPITYSLSEPLVEIGLKCRKLKSFCLKLRAQTPQLCVETFNSIQFMPQLKTLGLRLQLLDNEVLGVTDCDLHAFDSLKHWPKLTHLSLNLWQIHYKLFREIGINVPNLQTLLIYDPNCVINAICLDRISSLRKLQYLKINSTSGVKLNESHLKVFVIKCRKLESIQVFNKDKDESFKYNGKQIYEMRNVLPLSDLQISIISSNYLNKC